MTETKYIYFRSNPVHGSFGFHSRADHFVSCPDCNGTYEKQKIKKYTGRTDGRILKGLRVKFPIYMNRRNVVGVDCDNESTDETVVRLKQNK